MTQERFTNLTLLNTHKTRTDNIFILDVANYFAERNENRKRNFGTFKEADISSKPL